MTGLLQSNLLKRAFKLILTQTVSWSQWTGTIALNSAGQKVPTYATAQLIKGSWQAVSRQMYETFGLDLQKEYRMFYTPVVLQDLSRGTACDIVDALLTKGGESRRYNVESNTNWQLMNGWQGSLLVDVGPTP